MNTASNALKVLLLFCSIALASGKPGPDGSGTWVSAKKTEVILAYRQPNDKSGKVGWIPPYAFITDCLDIGGKCVEAKSLSPDGQFYHVEFAYVASKKECEPLFRDPKILRRIQDEFDEHKSRREKETESEPSKTGFDAEMRRLTEKLGGPGTGFCYARHTGWVAAKDLIRIKKEVPKPAKKPGKKAQVCGELCEQRKSGRLAPKDEAKESLENSRKIKEASRETPHASLIAGCGVPGRAREESKAGVMRIRLETVSYEVETRVFCRENGRKTFCSKTESHTECNISLPEGCGNEKVSTLEKTAAIADGLLQSGQDFCQRGLAEFYDKCGLWTDLGPEERIAKVQGIIGSVLKGIEVRGEKRSSLLSPELLLCVARRENNDFNPSRLSYAACMARKKTDPGPVMAGEFMKFWQSTASGLSQHLYKIVHGFWHQGWLANAHPTFADSRTTFKQMYGNPEKLFKAMSDDPVLDMEMAARHLDQNLEIIREYGDMKHPRKGSGHLLSDTEVIARAVRAYDGDQAKTYIPAVMTCMRCVNKSHGNVNGCLQHLHD